MRSSFIPALGVAIFSGLTPSYASSSGWTDAEGGSVRLITSGAADANGVIRGAIEIALKPGWKTYWRDPGDAGVPPTLEVSDSAAVAAAEMSFPAPTRFNDGYARWAGYDRPVAFPVTFKLRNAAETAMVSADLFLGICQTICVPVQARLEVDPTTDPDNVEDAAFVTAAVAALPGPEQPDFGVTLVQSDTGHLVVEANVPGDREAVEFFIAGSDGYLFGTPEGMEKDGRYLFSSPILDRPAQRPTSGALHYTLVTAEGAVEGLLPFP